MGSDNSERDTIASAITEISDSLTLLVHDEIELAKVEVFAKVGSLARGGAAVAAGAVFGVFAVIFALLTIALVIDDIFVSGVGEIWIGFLAVFVVLMLFSGGAFLFAWRKLKVGPPTPKLAIDEAKKIRETVSSSTGAEQ